MRGIGVDFGTTNSALALAEEDDKPRLARFARGEATTATFRSILYLEREEGGGPLIELAGPRAIERYLGADEPGRLIQSLKTFLASRDFSSTSVFGSPYRLEQLIASILRELRCEAESQFGGLEGRVVAGRPVRFAGASEPDDGDFALSRLRAAFRNAGFGEVVFEYEPVAAAYHYEAGLDHDELVLIADFGGGTSDFCLLHAGPSARGSERRADSILGTDGVAVAGDAFDGRLVRHVVAPLLGLGTEYRSIFDRVLTVPSWIYAHLQRWHHLSFLKSPRTLQMLFDLQREALEPEKLEALIHVVRSDLGFELYRSVESAKLALSEADDCSFRFRNPPVSIEERVSRGAFEGWIAEDIDAIAGCVDRLLASSSVAPADVDCVFMTGGSSLVPAVRAVFAERFGAGKIRSGSELTSVASGLALRARELARG